MIKLEKFTEQDFERLINWIDNEETLVQFSGPIFKFPLTKEQLNEYLYSENIISFKVKNLETNEIIGHSEIHKSENNEVKLCRILIGKESQRGKGFGKKIINELVKYSFEKLNAKKVELNVYDWNKYAIVCYEKTGFEMNPNKYSEIEVKGNKWISLNMILNKSKWEKLTKN
ncbi:GNAT family protein [Flavobacterium branchiophilum]|uniref:Probable acetyltransferase, GNAT family n=1 Tax=Flavobacterium branchiophilum (strain FL-15) TaxID=1034807 RepID=G2Z3J0_FLABF|nr:GNAT family protein [Flavobacterium branchiophilum]CCB70439.1 Probable acetyltransferase, GNAT family [Flavobacterium branchiophilum FL-15]